MESMINHAQDTKEYIPGKQLTVYSYGYHKSVDKTLTTFREHGRRDYQILYIDKGWGSFWIDGESKRLDAGTIVVIYPGQKNHYEFTGDSGSDYYWIHFYGEAAAPLLSQLRLKSGAYCIGSFFSFTESIEKIAHACAAKDFTTETYLTSVLIMLLSTISKKTYTSDSPVQKIIEQMQKENFNSLSNSDYAKLCDMSEYHFIRKFKQLTGTTPLQYKTRLIVNKAVHLMATTNLNISEIAFVLGFEDSLYFSRLFKKEMGIPPKKYKARLLH